MRAHDVIAAHSAELWCAGGFACAPAGNPRCVDEERDERSRREDDHEERDGDLPVEPAPPADDPDPEDVPPLTEPGAEQ